MEDTKDQDPSYLLANVHSEIERLRKQHVWLSQCQGGRLCYAPIDKSNSKLSILDVGCADGTVLRELKKEVSPTAQLTGLDVMPSFMPPSSEDGIEYVVGDLCDSMPATLTAKFDFTHLRLVILGCTKVSLEKVVSHLVDTLAPGGWLQVQEMDPQNTSADDPPSMQSLIMSMHAILRVTGLGVDFVERLPDLFRQAGLVDVAVHRVNLPVGRKIPNGTSENISNSIEPFKLTLPALVGGAKALDPNLNLNNPDDLIDQFEAEMMEFGTDAFVAVTIVGRKPA